MTETQNNKRHKNKTNRNTQLSCIYFNSFNMKALGSNEPFYLSTLFSHIGDLKQ